VHGGPGCPRPSGPSLAGQAPATKYGQQPRDNGFYGRGSREGAAPLKAAGRDSQQPVIFLAGGRVLTSYTQADIAQAADAQVGPQRDAYDLVGAGAGPAGRSATVYGASEGLSTWCRQDLTLPGHAL
jgi:hypothetical protein